MNGDTGTRNRQQDAACPASQLQDWAANPLCQLQIERHIHQVLFSGISLVVVFGRYAVGLNAIGHLGPPAGILPVPRVISRQSGVARASGLEATSPIPYNRK